jgi:hypothetical protein
MAAALWVGVVLAVAPEEVVAFAYAEVSAPELVVVSHRLAATPLLYAVSVGIVAVVCMRTHERTHKRDEQSVRVCSI